MAGALSGRVPSTRKCQRGRMFMRHHETTCRQPASHSHPQGGACRPPPAPTYGTLSVRPIYGSFLYRLFGYCPQFVWFGDLMVSSLCLTVLDCRSNRTERQRSRWMTCSSPPIVPPSTGELLIGHFVTCLWALVCVVPKRSVSNDFAYLYGTRRRIGVAR